MVSDFDVEGYLKHLRYLKWYEKFWFKIQIRQLEFAEKWKQQIISKWKQRRIAKWNNQGSD